MLYPGVELSLTAQTRESAAGLLEDKVLEIFKYYPLLADCCEYKSFTKDKAVSIFKNGSRITNLANHQSSKGKRRHSELKIRLTHLNIYAATIEKSVVDMTLKPVIPKAFITTIRDETSFYDGCESRNKHKG